MKTLDTFNITQEPTLSIKSGNFYRTAVIQRYIGVQDRNGRKICEGDYLLTNEGNWCGFIVFFDGTFMLVDPEGGYSAEPEWDECEIISNICEMDGHTREYVRDMKEGNRGMGETRFLTNREIYEQAVLKLVPSAKKRLWIATADIKDMYVEKPGLSKQMVPFLQILAELLQRGVAIRLIHAKEPGPAFRQDFDRFPGLWTGIERVLCPRVHFKCIIADGKRAYFGSANLTGAGMGAKGDTRRNFENGILTDDPAFVEPLSEQFDSVWRGAWCGKCGRRDYCTDCPVPQGHS